MGWRMAYSMVSFSPMAFILGKATVCVLLSLGDGMGNGEEVEDSRRRVGCTNSFICLIAGRFCF